MGLTNSSIGIKAVDSGLEIKKQLPGDKVIALAGNPNVGKSTVFNGLTGMNQHTGNWPGKTVTNAQGYCSTKNHSYVLVDIPGTYSLMAHSAEEEVARNFICFGEPDVVVVVCDATCLERNLNLVLQTLEISKNVIVCINLMDEAKRKHIKIDLNAISKRLGVPVVGAVARKKNSLSTLMEVVDKVVDGNIKATPLSIQYPKEIEEAIGVLEPVVKNKVGEMLNSRWLSLKLLDQDESLVREINTYLGYDFLNDEELNEAYAHGKSILDSYKIDSDLLKDKIVSSLVRKAEEVCLGAVTFEKEGYNASDRKIDKILTSKVTGYPIMLALLALVFWLTITGANYPSQMLADGLFWVQDRLTEFFQYMNAPNWLHGILVLGVFRVLAWVVSVMLPPMAIFFPLFTLLEDAGYLPRVAYNLDKSFKRCCACGKQALTMCMGFGCNAAGIVGCRIIDSPRERLLAILTNNFVPCNGRFPTLIAILTMFFVGTAGGAYSSIVSALLLTSIIVLGIFVTFAVTKILSKTLLKGVPSSFTLELPPYRKPQIGKVIVRSIFDRTLFVLGRAIVVAAPAGMVIWLMANITVGDTSVLNHCASFLDPLARLMGLDGVILLAFILGFPANEIVVPIIIMAYMSQGSILELDSLVEMKELFVNNGWTWITAICTMLFSLMHWPCSTTLLTIKKETGSWKWTALAAGIPTAVGIMSCIFFATAARIFL
ncbi:ferrous iron transport protein B [Anaerotignum sp. MB30-C6]|uniref:ferrous iron transport protein B n=1 Tax=Anaerotignum sp. MB30-C6 TaxID=3070814 RepID=UPI0027DCEABD|nr:ferrous iron transport protein B [Anaerotignum sp. MB30-C6]WMI82139.1 ferrous iron transport protein B [Anaerotignum sp. MB30-C6]